MPEQPTLEQLLIEAVQCHIARSRGPGYSLTLVRIGIRGPDGLESEVSLHPARCFTSNGIFPPEPSTSVGPNAGVPVAGHEPAAVRALTPTESAIMDVLRVADRPLKGILLARRAGKDYNGHFREVLGRMQRNEPPLIIHLAGGYWDASRPLDARSSEPGTGESPGDGRGSEDL